MNTTRERAAEHKMDQDAWASSKAGQLPIDFTRLFIAEHFTPLAHASAYDLLSDSARLRYNQLHAFYFNEQVAFFEQEMLSPALRALRKQPLPAHLKGGLEVFFEEEQQHTARFRALNRCCAPEFYSDSPYYFVRTSRLLCEAVGAAAARPHLFPLFLWLALMQEERSLYYSKGCLECASILEPHFLATHRWHLADEIGHVGWDEELLDWLWPQVGRTVRVMNARLLNWLIGEFFLLPRRSGRRVVQRLVEEHAELDAAALYRGMTNLKNNTAYLETLYSREITPRSFARFDAHSEFALLVKTLPGYRPAGSPV